MTEAKFGAYGGLPATDEHLLHDEREAGTYPTPAGVLWEFGGIVAFCLGLGVLAYLLVPMVPQ